MSDATEHHQEHQGEETRSKAYERVSKEWRDNCESPAPKIIRGRLPLDTIEVEEEVFQQRDVSAYDFGPSESHVGGLVEALLRSPTSKLDPIEVWWSGRRWIVVDGHHRLRAYHSAAEQGGVRRTRIPAKAFTGDLSAALGRSLEGNSKDKLPMSEEEKSDAAWRFVCLAEKEGLKVKEIASMSNRSEKTVKNMRRVRLDLIKAIDEGKVDDLTLDELADLRWWSARRLRDDWTYKPWDEERVNAEVVKMSRKLRGILGGKPQDIPEVFARAICMAWPDLPPLLVDSEALSDEVERLMQMRAGMGEVEADPLADF